MGSTPICSVMYGPNMLQQYRFYVGILDKSRAYEDGLMIEPTILEPLKIGPVMVGPMRIWSIIREPIKMGPIMLEPMR